MSTAAIRPTRRRNHSTPMTYTSGTESTPNSAESARAPASLAPKICSQKCPSSGYSGARAVANNCSSRGAVGWRVRLAMMISSNQKLSAPSWRNLSTAATTSKTAGMKKPARPRDASRSSADAVFAVEEVISYSFHNYKKDNLPVQTRSPPPGPTGAGPAHALPQVLDDIEQVHPGPVKPFDIQQLDSTRLPAVEVGFDVCRVGDELPHDHPHAPPVGHTLAEPRREQLDTVLNLDMAGFRLA